MTIRMMQSRSRLYYWIPVLPFLIYWSMSYYMFYFGKFINPEINWYSHLYFFVANIVLVFGYKLGLKNITKCASDQYSIDDRLALSVLKKTSLFTFIGTLIFVFDRINSGAGSLDMIQNEMANIREEYAGNTTILTALAVIPQSFRIVAFGSYFYCAMYKIKIPKFVHYFMFSILALEAINMALTASRGSLFWTFTYFLFFVFFCTKINFSKDIFSFRHIKIKFVFIMFCIASIAYFYFVAKNREFEEARDYLGVKASYLLKDPMDSNYVDYADLGAQYSLYYYVTHGFQYFDAILKHAPIINFDFLSPLGIRIEYQIGKLVPGYVHPAKLNILNWLDLEGLSPFGWPTIFGAALSYFGIFGSIIFFYVVGYLSGHAMRQYVRSNKLGWFIIVLLVYTSFNLSFDWILRDIDQFVAMIVGVYLIITTNGKRIR